jgi:hypothetical protein
MSENDEESDKVTLYEIIITEDLKPGNLVQVKFGNEILCRFVYALDRFSATEKYKLIKTSF